MLPPRHDSLLEDRAVVRFAKLRLFVVAGAMLMGGLSLKCNANPAAIDRTGEVVQQLDGLDVDIDVND
jgi:hypothetical protein